MLYYGNLNNVQDTGVVLNFTSPNEYYQRLNLIPPNSLGATSDYDFDVKYMNWIMSDDYRFSQMFDIIEYLYQGFDVYIIISDDSWSENLIESLLKLIQQRYGYNATRIDCLEDLTTSPVGGFNTEYGLYNFDEDEDRYCYYIEAMRRGGNSA